MRSRILAVPFALCLVLVSAGFAAADTTPGGGGAEGGLDFTITSIGVTPKSGEVTISGEVTCEVNFDWVTVQVELAQIVGRLHTLRGWGWADIPGGCRASDGTASFTLSFYAESGVFKPGKATMRADAYGDGDCYEIPDDDYYCDTWGWASSGPTAIRLGRTR